VVVVDWFTAMSSDAFYSEVICSEALCSEVVCSGTMSLGTRISVVGAELFLGEFGF